MTVVRTATFVLLHGGAHGGWCYRWLAAELRARGHVVHAPTLTGFGERGHLAHCEPTTDDHVLEVVNVLTYEDLDDVVLVGHSLGGVVIPEVARRVPERIRRVVWLAAIVLDDGETVLDHFLAPSEAIREATEPGPDGDPPDPMRLVEVFLPDGTPEQRAWVRDRLGPTTMASLTHPGDLSGFLATGLPTGYVTALRDLAVPPDLARRFADRLPGCRRVDVDAGHDLMISAPAATADALEVMLD